MGNNKTINKKGVGNNAFFVCDHFLFMILFMIFCDLFILHSGQIFHIMPTYTDEMANETNMLVDDMWKEKFNFILLDFLIHREY